jgi:4-hydroxy-tetrahydrodipicolinate synthase
VISVASNIIPDIMVKFTKLMNNGDWEQAKLMHLQLYDLFKVLFIESNPGPVKYAADYIGLMDVRMRLPLTPPLKENQKLIKYVLKDLNIV